MSTSFSHLQVIRLETLILARTDDPIIPVANDRITAALLQHATLHCIRAATQT